MNPPAPVTSTFAAARPAMAGERSDLTSLYPAIMAWRVPLADVQVSDADIARVAETYRSGWLSMGPRTQELEEAFADYVGVEHALAVANGTAGLHLMTAGIGLGPGDEVIVP